MAYPIKIASGVRSSWAATLMNPLYVIEHFEFFVSFWISVKGEHSCAILA
jgi:hypothetical protein